jgi:WD40 repeat protein
MRDRHTEIDRSKKEIISSRPYWGYTYLVFVDKTHKSEWNAHSFAVVDFKSNANIMYGLDLATCSSAGKIALWESSCRMQAVEVGPVPPIRMFCDAAFSPDRKFLATAADDSTVRIWDVSSRICVFTMRGHTDSVTSIAFSPDGRVLVSGSNDATIKLWKCSNWKCFRTFGAEDQVPVSSVTFVPHSSNLASGDQFGTIRLWDLDTLVCMATLLGHEDTVTRMAFSPDGNLLASGSGDSTVRLWDVRSTTCTAILQSHQACVRSVALSPDGTTLASCSDDKTVRLWDVRTPSGPVTETVIRVKDPVYCLAFSVDGRTIAAGTLHGTTLLVDVPTLSIQRCVQSRTLGDVSAVAFRPEIPVRVRFVHVVIPIGNCC